MPRTVLIVDDNPWFRTSARRLLETEGFEIVGEADTGAAGLLAVNELHPDLVLLDVQLPDVDGFEIATRLSAQNGSMPAVILTSSRDASEFGGLIAKSGARGFVAKGELSGAAIQALL